MWRSSMLPHWWRLPMIATGVSGWHCGVNMEPVRLQTVEKELEDQPVASSPADGQRVLAALQKGIAHFRPPSDFRASSDYRRVSGVNLAYRVLEEAMNTSNWHSVITSEGKI